jgi:PAS domain S-box-containing protein
MPRFTAVKALAVLRESGQDIPFIIISGTVGEEVAIKAMHTGANDYLRKGNLIRLVSAIERELQEAANRRTQRQSEEARRLTEERYRTLFECAPDGIIIANPDSYYLDANASMCRMLGYTHKELIGLHASDIVTQAEIKNIQPTLDSISPTTDHNGIWQFRRKDASVFTGEVMVTEMPDGNLMAMIRDVTERQQAEETIRQSETQLSEAQRLAHIGSWDWNLKSDVLVWSDEMYRIFGLEPGEIDLAGKEVISEHIHPEDSDLLNAAVLNSIETLAPFDFRYRVMRPDKSVGVVHAIGQVTVGEDGTATRIYGTGQDITDRNRTEEERKVVSEIIHGVITTPNLDEFLALVHRSIGRVMYADNCFVMLHDPATDMTHFNFWVDKRDPHPPPQIASKGFSSYVLRSGQPLLITKKLKKAMIASGEVEQVGSVSPSWIGVPLRTPERTIGVMVLQHYGFPFIGRRSDRPGDRAQTH